MKNKIKAAIVIILALVSLYLLGIQHKKIEKANANYRASQEALRRWHKIR